MFKQKKIHQFIKKYGWELSDYGWGISDNDFSELEEFLNKTHGFSSLIKKINKLQRKEKEYVIETLKDYKKYGFNEIQVEDILYDKINFVKNNKHAFKYPNLDHLYYVFRSNEEVYKSFIIDYKEEKEEQSTTITLASYYEVINKYYKEFSLMFKEKLELPVNKFEKYLFSLSPRCLCNFFGFVNENKIPISIQKEFLNQIGGKEYFSKLSISDFNDILEFIFKCKDETNQKVVLDRKIDIILSLEDEFKNNWSYINALGNLPDDYILGIFDDKSIEYDTNFLILLKESDNHIKNVITNFIDEIKSHYNDSYYKILKSDIINKLSSNTLEFVLNNVIKLSREDESIKFEKIHFLMNCAVLDNKMFIEKSLKYVENDEDVRIISTKINCIKNIIPHVYNNEVSIDQYEKYLSILSDGLDGKSINEQIDILESKCNYFEKTNAYGIMDRLDTKFISLLNIEENRNDTIYSLINKSCGCYSDDIAKNIIDRIEKLKTHDNKEMYIDFIIDEFFASSDTNRQRVLLNLFDNKTVSINFAENNSSVVAVSPFVHGIVSNSDEPLEFVNKDTGLKIFVKQMKKD